MAIFRTNRFSIGFFAGAFALWMASGTANAADHSTGGYIGVDYTYGFLGDADTKYRNNDSVSYEFEDDDDSGSVSFGYDFGNVRTELKVTYFEGNVSKVDGETTKDGSEYNYGLVTIGALYDFDDIEFNDQVSLTPFIGVGSPIK